MSFCPETVWTGFPRRIPPGRIAAIPQEGESDDMELKPEDFEPWVGRKVRVSTLPEPVEITLAQVFRRSPLRGIDVRTPFSLFFESPLDVYLIDAAYDLDCGRGGPHSILITQIQPLQDRRIYEAVFS